MLWYLKVIHALLSCRAVAWNSIYNLYYGWILLLLEFVSYILIPLIEEIQNKHIVTNGNHPCSTFGVKDLLSSQSLRGLYYIIWFLCSCHLITDIVEYNAFTKSYVGRLWESSDTLTIKYCVTKLKENESECFFNNIIDKWSTPI